MWSYRPTLMLIVGKRFSDITGLQNGEVLGRFYMAVLMLFATSLPTLDLDILPVRSQRIQDLHVTATAHFNNTCSTSNCSNSIFSNIQHTGTVATSLKAPITGPKTKAPTATALEATALLPTALTA